MMPKLPFERDHAGRSHRDREMSKEPQLCESSQPRCQTHKEGFEAILLQLLRVTPLPAEPCQLRTVGENSRRLSGFDTKFGVTYYAATDNWNMIDLVYSPDPFQSLWG